MGLINQATRNLFFTGKGGVGKTTTATATAIALADLGRKVLLVSTDPASNLDEVLGVELGSTPVEITGVARLMAMNIDPEAAASAYREQIVGPYRGVLPDEAVTSIEEQLSGACTVEIAAFDEFAKLLGSPAASAGFDHVIFDTAPTGHTLRLLELPAAWTDFLDNSAGGTSCLGPLSGLGAQRELYSSTRKALADAVLTTIVVVSRPDESALHEAARASAELATLGVTNQRLVLNGIFSTGAVGDPVAAAFAERNRRALRSIPDTLDVLPRTDLPLSASALVGIASLRGFFSGETPSDNAPESGSQQFNLPSLEDLVTALESAGRGVIMTMGKGGVGKTTLAAVIAIRLAQQGHRVHLTTTDPAAHVAEAVGTGTAGLTIGRIDPTAETQAYAHEVMATVGDTLDDQGRALLEEDLRSPCTEEIAVFRAFAQVVAQGTDGFVVIDTAPTGHTLLLLDAAEAYHRQVSQTMSAVPEEVRQLLPRLRDPDFTRIMVVTLPEPTPVHEAAALQRDLQRAGIEPYGWVVNQSLTPHVITDPLLSGRRSRELRYIEEASVLSRRVYLGPWLSDPLKTS
jgi:arsenite/tail-anchored protein-transporting ATPase